MKKWVVTLLFSCLAIGSFWGQNLSLANDSINALSNPIKQDSTQGLSRFLQNIAIKEDYSFHFDRDFLKPKDVSLRKMLQTRYYNSINYLKEVSLNEALYPNLNYPSGILIDNSTNFLIKPFPEVNQQF